MVEVIRIVLWIVDSGCSNHMTDNLKLLRNFIKKFVGIVHFGNDHFAAITGYRDYVHGNVMICHVYYVEGLGYNLFSVDMAASSPVCLLSKATLTKSWLWHRRLSLLNFGTINHLIKQDLVDGLPKSKYDKDHLCFACEQRKRKKAIIKPKLVPSTHSKLELIHMDLCGPMRVESINEKKYIMSMITLVTHGCIFLVRTDNDTEFKNEKLRSHYEKLGIIHQTLIARNPQKNGVVEQRDRTLVEVARTMLIFSKPPEFLVAEAISTACFTQNPNDRVDVGKMKPKANIKIFIGYSESSRGFRIYNRRTRKVMESIHVKFDELTTMASEHGCLEPESTRFNVEDLSVELNQTPSKEDLDDLFGPLYEEYYVERQPEVSTNFAAPTALKNKDTPSLSTIIIDDNEDPPLVSTSEEPTSSMSNDLSDDESIQEDTPELDENTFITLFCPHVTTTKKP
ncbi:retrovirus-related pol polyprotein from transposon TNT 1-94 [Tanacetum coccineum]